MDSHNREIYRLVWAFEKNQIGVSIYIKKLTQLLNLGELDVDAAVYYRPQGPEGIHFRN